MEGVLSVQVLASAGKRTILSGVHLQVQESW